MTKTYTNCSEKRRWPIRQLVVAMNCAHEKKNLNHAGRGARRARQHDQRVERVHRPVLAAERLLAHRDEHARDRAEGEVDRVEAVLGPDARALLDPLLRDLEDERRRRQHDVHRDARQAEAVGAKAHVGRPDLREAVDEVDEAREAEHLVDVERVLPREQRLPRVREPGDRPHRGDDLRVDAQMNNLAT